MGDWSVLPCELLGEIALKLDSIEDFVYFSVVCSSFYCAYSTIKKKWTSSRFLLLLLPENTKKNPNYLRKLFCPNKQRCYELELPEIFGARCWGTSSGWIVTVNLTLELYVFNPFTGVRIRLPPHPSLPFIREIGEDNPDWLRLKCVDKTYVFDVSDDNLVVALHGGPFHAQIVFARPGDEAWSRVITHKRCVHDVLRRGTQLLAVFDDGMLGYCDIPTFQPEMVVRNYLPKPPIGDDVTCDTNSLQEILFGIFWSFIYCTSAQGNS